MFNDRKFLETFVDVRGQYGDVHIATFAYFNSHAIGVALVGGQKRRHKFRWIVRFEVRGLVSDERIACRMGIVNDNIISQKIMSAFYSQVIRFFGACWRDRNDLIPVNIRR